MDFFRAVLASAALLLLPGCGYIHFGRLPTAATGTGDAGMAEAYSALSTEHKILKQELALARKEGDALRATLDRASGTTAAPELLAQLNATTRELASLRASHAKLQAERAGTAGPATALEEQLAGALRAQRELQEANARLRTELQRSQAENTSLADQLKSAVARHEQAQGALAQLNAELLAQKDARDRAEQANTAARAQLAAVLAAGGTSDSSAANASLSGARTPPAEASASAELRTNPERLRAADAAAPAPDAAPAKRLHTVQAGDTLEGLSIKYYGTPDRWRQIYDANEALLGGGKPMTIGMPLAIPEK